MMETPSDYSSESDEDQYYDATEEVHHENTEAVQRLRLDDMFGSGESIRNTAEKNGKIEGEDNATGETDSRTKTITPAHTGIVKDQVSSAGSEIDNNIATNPENSEYSFPPEIKLEKCESTRNTAEEDGKIEGEDIATGDTDSRTKTVTPAHTDIVKDQVSSTGSEIDNNIATNPENSEYSFPPEIKLEKCDKSTLEPNKTHSDEDTNELSDSNENGDSNKEEIPVKDEMAARIEMEGRLNEEEKLERKEKAQQDKLQGNAFFKSEEYLEACDLYTTALEVCPLTFKKERSIMYSNRAACRLRLEQLEEAVSDCTEAITLNPLYMKALLRRAKTYELLEKLDEALADYQKALEMDAGCHGARSACMRLPDLIKERNEKLKEEMMGKLKDLGNMVLRPFGLSTNNFQFQQDPNTGSYSMNFVQTPRGGNGK